MKGSESKKEINAVILIGTKKVEVRPVLTNLLPYVNFSMSGAEKKL